MLPPTRCDLPAASKIAPISAVVVVLPFVPVTASTWARVSRRKSSTSLTSSTPRASASPRALRSQASVVGIVGEMLGLVTSRSAAATSARASSGETPSASWTGRPPSARTASASSAGGRRS